MVRNFFLSIFYIKYTWRVSCCFFANKYPSSSLCERIFTICIYDTFLITSLLCVLCVAVASVEGTFLNITKVNRLHMGSYLCIASNGVPPSVSKRIMLTVHCTYYPLAFCCTLFQIESVQWYYKTYLWILIPCEKQLYIYT